MKYFLDTEFLEGPQQKRLFGIPCGKTKPTIDLISIGIVSEDGREYYAISKEFNLWEAWNRYDLKEITCPIEGTPSGKYRKIYWIRENVLKPIFQDLLYRYNPVKHNIFDRDLKKFNYKNFSTLLSMYGKSNKQISEEVFRFCRANENKIHYHNNSNEPYDWTNPGSKFYYAKLTHQSTQPEFYTYYGDYDWVVFCWLFGKMIDLPKGFPMYSRDLKQMLDEKAQAKEWYYGRDIWSNTENRGTDIQKGDYPATLEDKIGKIKKHDDYPKQENEHNALADAKWNKKLYEFLQSL